MERYQSHLSIGERTTTSRPGAGSADLMGSRAWMVNLDHDQYNQTQANQIWRQSVKQFDK
jgi:hypothetical protein